VRRIGIESVEDVNAHGIDGGFAGFIYTRDCVRFFLTHKASILKMAEHMARELSVGGDTLTLVQNFRCLGKDYSLDDIGEALFGKGATDAADQIRNAMAWFAAEEVCRIFED
jgi:hypothetical protein